MAAKGAIAGGGLIGGAMPTTGTVLTVKATTLGDAVEEACRRDARIFGLVKAVYDSQTYALFVMLLGAILVAVAVDLHRMPVIMAEIDEDHIVPNPLVRFILPDEALGVAVNVDRSYRARRAATAQADGAAPAEPIREPGWIGTPNSVV
jgi:hypothetical protein